MGKELGSLTTNNFASTLPGTVWATFQKWKRYSKEDPASHFPHKVADSAETCSHWGPESVEYHFLAQLSLDCSRQSACVGIVADSMEFFSLVIKQE